MADEELHARGDCIYVLNSRNKTNYYGILVNNVSRGAHWGTCIWDDPKVPPAGNAWGTIVTLGHKELNVAWKRVNNKDETSPYKRDVPYERLRLLLKQGQMQGELFSIAITISERSFAAELDLKAEAKRTASRNRSSKPPKFIPPYRKNLVPFEKGTKVAAHFKWEELFLNKADGERMANLPGCSRTGRDFVGTVISFVENDDNINRNYTCLFNTPTKHTLVFDEKHIKPLIEAYELLENESSPDGLSSSDSDVSVPKTRKKLEGPKGRPVSAAQETKRKQLEERAVNSIVTRRPTRKSVVSVLPVLPIGTEVARWATKQNLIAMGDKLQDGGTWIDGIICDVRPIKGRRVNTGEQDYQITFELPYLCTEGDLVNKWYSAADTHDMAKQFVQRQGDASDNQYLKPPRGQILCKGTKQRRQVAEACEVGSRRTPRTTKIRIPQTPDDHLSPGLCPPTSTVSNTSTVAEATSEQSHEEWNLDNPRERLRFEIDEALTNLKIANEMELLGNTLGTANDSANLQYRRNLLSYHLAGGDKKPEQFANVAQGTQKTPVSGITSEPRTQTERVELYKTKLYKLEGTTYVEGCLQHIVSVTNADKSTTGKYDCAFKTNPMSSIVVGWEDLQKLINNHVHYNKQLETSLPPPPPPPPSSQGTPTHVDSIVDNTSPTIETLANGEKVLGNLCDSTKLQLQQIGLTQLRNGKIVPASAQDCANERLDNAAMRLLHADKRLVLVPRDGNCMFSALAICYGGLISSSAIRQEAVNYVVAHWKDPDFPFCTFVQGQHPDETIESYTRRLLGPGKDWGDYPELVAAANVYRHHLYILDLELNATNLRAHYVEAEGLKASARTYFVVRVGDNHYHAAIPVGVATSSATVQNPKADVTGSAYAVVNSTSTTPDNAATQSSCVDIAADMESEVIDPEATTGKYSATPCNILSYLGGTHYPFAIVLGVGPNFNVILTRLNKPFCAAFGKLSHGLIMKIAGFLTCDPQTELLARRLNELQDVRIITWPEFFVELSFLQSLLCHGPDIVLATQYQLIRNNRRGPFQNPAENRRLVTIEVFFELRPRAQVTYNTDNAPVTAERLLNQTFTQRQMTCQLLVGGCLGTPGGGGCLGTPGGGVSSSGAARSNVNSQLASKVDDPRTGTTDQSLGATSPIPLGSDLKHLDGNETESGGEVRSSTITVGSGGDQNANDTLLVGALATSAATTTGRAAGDQSEVDTSGGEVSHLKVPDANGTVLRSEVGVLAASSQIANNTIASETGLDGVLAAARACRTSSEAGDQSGVDTAGVLGSEVKDQHANETLLGRKEATSTAMVVPDVTADVSDDATSSHSTPVQCAGDTSGVGTATAMANGPKANETGLGDVLATSAATMIPRESGDESGLNTAGGVVSEVHSNESVLGSAVATSTADVGAHDTAHVTEEATSFTSTPTQATGDARGVKTSSDRANDTKMTATEAGDERRVEPDAKEDDAGSVEEPIEVGEAEAENTENARKSTLLTHDERLSKLSRKKLQRIYSIKQQLSERKRRKHVKGSESEVRPLQKLIPKVTTNKPTHRKGSNFKLSRNKPNWKKPKTHQLSETRSRKDGMQYESAVPPPLGLMPKGTKRKHDNSMGSGNERTASKKLKLPKQKQGQKSAKNADSASTARANDPKRHGISLPLQPGDHGLLDYHMRQFFAMDKDSEAMQPGDPYYDIFIRIHTFDIEKNNLEDFNNLMDIVCPAKTKPHQEGEDRDLSEELTTFDQSDTDDLLMKNDVELSKPQDHDRLKLLASIIPQLQEEGGHRNEIDAAKRKSKKLTDSKGKRPAHTMDKSVSTSSKKLKKRQNTTPADVPASARQNKPHKVVTSKVSPKASASKGGLHRKKKVPTGHEPFQPSSGFSDNINDDYWASGQDYEETEDDTNVNEVEGRYGEGNGYYLEGKWHSWNDTAWIDGVNMRSRRPPPNKKLRNYVAAMRRNEKLGIKEASLKSWTITRDRMSEASGLLEKHGVCVIEDFFTDWQTGGKVQKHRRDKPLFTCSTKQAEYILRQKTKREEAFNGVRMMSQSSGFKAHIAGKATRKKKVQQDGPRMMLAPCQENQHAMEEYHFQMDLLIEHMFPANQYSKKQPSAWLKKMTNLVGGTEYQHAHSDQGRANAFSQETTFPFVAMHGFGVNSFEMWLLPQNMKHGFLHKFKHSSLLLMRGDFVHAGGTSKLPRCHMEFFPLPAAGLVHDHAHHYWLEPDFKCDIDERSGDENDTRPETVFLVQGTIFPFAYPLASYEKNNKGRIRTVLTYPPDVTKLLLTIYKSTERDEIYEKISKQRF